MSLNEIHSKQFGSAILLRGRKSPKIERPVGDREIIIQRAVERASNARAIGQVLRAIVPPEGPIWKSELEELNDVLTADYRTAAALPVPETVRHLAGILDTSLDPRDSVWKKWRRIVDFRVLLPDFGSQEIAVRVSRVCRNFIIVCGLMIARKHLARAQRLG